MEPFKLGKYRHFKNHDIEAVAVAKHTETEEEYVVYKDLSNNSWWVRPRAMFEESVERDGQTMPRFSYLGKN